ncbi:MAG: hypothetical protein KDF60_11480, partial [Calditrichaeota bacterium]|nr:hypothetical protein [Calditrichota bacterium]
KFFKRGIVGYQIQIETIHWLFRTFPELQYHNIPGLCLAGTKKELAELTQNEPDYFYVSLDDPFDYELTFKKLKKALTLYESGI